MKKNGSKKMLGGIIMMSLFLSMGMTVYAATATTSFNYAGKTVNCELKADFGLGKDEAYGKTYVNGGSGLYPLGAYLLAFNNGDLVGSDNVTAFDSAKTKTLSVNATEFRSTHNIQDSNRRPLESTKLTNSK